jgi:hypothetical protein
MRAPFCFVSQGRRGACHPSRTAEAKAEGVRRPSSACRTAMRRGVRAVLALRRTSERGSCLLIERGDETSQGRGPFAARRTELDRPRARRDVLAGTDRSGIHECERRWRGTDLGLDRAIRDHRPAARRRVAGAGHEQASSPRERVPLHRLRQRRRLPCRPRARVHSGILQVPPVSKA